MRVLMLGWEFPPFISGGLGTACYGLTKALGELGTEVAFLLPHPVHSQYSTHVKLLTPGCGSSSVGILSTAELVGVTLRPLDIEMYPYGKPGEIFQPVGEVRMPLQHSSIRPTQASGERNIHDVHDREIPPNNYSENYSGDLYTQTQKYSHLARTVAREEVFDVVHAHDWMTYPAGIAVAKTVGKPLVVHVHSTEFDRSGAHVNQWVYDVERRGMHRADRVITVSHLTKRICIDLYGVPEAKISVVHNGVDNTVISGDSLSIKKDKFEKIVLFLGRITMQKGPEYFVAAAKKVLDKMEDVKFIMAGSGDMFTRTIELTAELGIGHKVLFPGFLRGKDVDRVFRMADLYVMPSVSEPFGISPLEALVHDVPVIISKQSGVAEILHHALKVDFWDINEMANKIIAVLRHQPLHETLRKNGTAEVRNLQWTDAARKCRCVYETMKCQVA